MGYSSGIKISLLFAFALSNLQIQRSDAFINRPFTIQPKTSELRPTSRVNLRRIEITAALLNPPKRKANSDWITNLGNLPKSVILNNISNHLWVNGIWTLVLTFLAHEKYVEFSKVNPFPYALMTSVLGLVLVFRTNAGYDRFWEGRKVWGSIVNTIRNVAGTVQGCIDEKEHKEFAKYITAFPYTLKQRLQLVRNDAELMEVTGFSQKEINDINDSGNPPLFVVQKLREMIGKAEYVRMEDRDEFLKEKYFFRYRMEELLSLLVDFHGMCERILMTPVPMSYTRHTSRFLSLYCLSLPFAMIPVAGDFTPLVMILITWLLFSVEEIGLFVEQPFDIKGDIQGNGELLLLTNYCGVMKKDIDNVLLGKQLPGLFDDFDVPPMLTFEELMQEANALKQF